MTNCPKCGAHLPEGSLYCKVCGEDIHIVPDYDVTMEVQLERTARSVRDSDRQERMEHDRREREFHENRKKLLCMLLVLGVLGGVLVTLIITMAVHSFHSGSKEYQMRQAAKYQALGEYDRAVIYCSRAMALDPGDLSLHKELAELYYIQNREEAYEAALKDILGQENAGKEEILWTMERLLPVMKRQGEFREICDLLEKLQLPELDELYGEYLAPKPEFMLQPGEYDDLQSLEIRSPGQGRVYYSLDERVPGEDTHPYTVPIVLDYGENIVSACYINAYGVKSQVVTGSYYIHGEPVDTQER